MVRKILQTVKDFTWFLHSGIAPKNVPNRYKQNLEDINHMASKKFAMTMVAISIIAFMYFTSVAILFLLPKDPQISALVSMYKDMIVAVASIVATLVGIQGLVDWKYNSETNTSLSNEAKKEERYIEEYLSGPKEDDYSLDIELVSKKKK